MTRTVTLTLPLSDELLDGTAITAADGGYGAVSYWAQGWCIAWHDEDKGKDVLDRRAVGVEIEQDVDELTEAQIAAYEAHNAERRDHDGTELIGCTLTLDDLADGIRRLLSGEVRIADYILGYIQRGVREDDGGEIDAEAADAIVQAALFGEIIYG